MGNGKSLMVSALKTDIFHQGGDIYLFLKKRLREISLEGNILAITSKIVSLAENQTVSKESISKKELVKMESDFHICEGGYGVDLTIKHGLLIPSAGIDESNSELDAYILYPKDPFASAQTIWGFLKKEFSLDKFGVILTDSSTIPLRRGVTGISLAHWGIKATRSLVGRPDIFKRPLEYTLVNVVDSLASMAVFAMGESDEISPLALVCGAKVEFTRCSSLDEISIEPEIDLYAPLLQPFR